MSDWKDAIDAEASRKLGEKLAKKGAARRKNLKGLGRRFKCHICGYRATEPSRKVHADLDWGLSRWVDNWNEPADLTRCGRCGRWTCSRCLHASGYLTQSVCRKCGEKVLRGGGAFRYGFAAMLAIAVASVGCALSWIFFDLSERLSPVLETLLGLLKKIAFK